MMKQNKYNNNSGKELANYSLKFIVIFVVIGCMTGCGKSLKLDSKWRSFELDMKETGNDWGSAAVYAEKEQVSLSVLNDSTYIYIRLYSRARGVQGQIMGMGFTIWFDPKGGQKKFVGIHFPLGRMNYGMPMMDKREMERPSNPEEMIEKSLDEMNELEIMTPGNQQSHRIALATAETLGISVKWGRLHGGLVYQLKIPFSEFGFSLVGADTTPAIGIGFETSQMDRGGPGGRMGGEDMDGMMPPWGPRGMPGGGMPGGGAMPERLNLWTIVKLASKPSVQD